MTVKLQSSELRMHNLRARMPFRYGMATLTALPHLLIEAHVQVGGRTITAHAAEQLPPKWFVKEAGQSYRDELASMLHVIETAFAFAEQLGRFDDVFDLWQALYGRQMRWALDEGYPPLLWNFGVSLVERVVIDATCRAGAMTFSQAVRGGGLGIRLGELHADLGDATPAELLPAEPTRRMAVRHTVGLGDPLTDDQIDEADRLDDGLPQSLAAAIDCYGLRYFKIKLSGTLDTDLPRLRQISALLAERGLDEPGITLDGNEQFADAGALADYWAEVRRDEALAPLLGRLIALEQPLRREVAMAEETCELLADWPEAPPMIVDESDGLVGSLAAAIDAGYVGGSAKSCKGIIKAIANACFIEHLRRTEPDRPWVFTGEDLATVGPVGLPQDLALMATLGLSHIERNGHHYFRGLDAWPPAVRAAMIEHHSDLYQAEASGLVTLRIEAGAMNLDSVLAAPFGHGPTPPMDAFTPVDDWRYESLENG